MKLLLLLEWDLGMTDTFTLRIGRRLITFVRDVRRLELSPILALSPSEFIMLLDHWPQFYLAGPVVKTHAKRTLYSRLRRLFVRRKRTPPALPVRFSDDALSKIRERMLSAQAVPVDGIWVPVSVLENESNKSTDDNNPN